MNGRIATLMVHTSPLDQPGIGDAGGMNIYVLESAQRMAAMGLKSISSRAGLKTFHQISLKYPRAFEFATLIADMEI